MKFFSVILIYLIFFFPINAEEIIIELHRQSIDQFLEDNRNTEEENTEEENTEEENTEEEIIVIENTQLDQESLSETVEKNNIENNDIVAINESIQNDDILTIPDFWENADRDEILFLLENLKPVSSKVLTRLLMESFLTNSPPPKSFTNDEFNNLKIKNLIKLGQRESAFTIINQLDSTQLEPSFYNIFKLNHYFAKYELSQACDFSDSIDRKKIMNDNNFILKVDIFCSFVQNKTEEANFRNLLLEDTNDQDEYFQDIFFNLKNGRKEQSSINNYKHDKNIIPFYSAMLRVGDIPLDDQFLKYDSINLAMPIVLSGSSDISLRLRAAHQAYQQGIFNAESLSALYQTVDFTYDELVDSSTLKQYNKKSEIGMAYLFRKANIQLLPITRLQTLVEFWEFAESQNLSLLAYDISRNLIDKIEPSAELSEYGIYIAKAHIYNENFELAEKWILFTENYKTDDENLKEKIDSIKLLYNLKNSIDQNQFERILLESDFFIEKNQNKIKEEILLTILSVIDEKNENNINGARQLIDERSMPSRYLLNKIKKSAEQNNFGELALSIGISMINKTWIDVHPEHLRIILFSLRKTNVSNVFKRLIFEILEDSKII